MKASYVFSPCCIARVVEIVVCGAEACFTVIITIVINIYRTFIQEVRNDFQFLVHLKIFLLDLGRKAIKVLSPMGELRRSKVKPPTPDPREHK